MNRPGAAGKALTRRAPPAVRLALKVLLVGFICYLSAEVGFAHKVPPHNISALWPTGAILFSVLVVTPVRHWWAYTLAAYFGSVVNDARAGFPVAAILFIVAGIVEILIAAVGVRRFADGPRAFDNLRGLVAYIIVAVVLAPFLSAFVAAFAGATRELLVLLARLVSFRRSRVPDVGPGDPHLDRRCADRVGKSLGRTLHRSRPARLRPTRDQLPRLLLAD